MNDPEFAPRLYPTLIEVETRSGKVEDAGSVHTCLHDGDVRMVHYRVAYDDTTRRVTDRLSNVPAVGRMVQTWEVKPCGAGTRFSFYYSIRPEVPIEDEEARSGILRVIRQHAEGDVQGVKAFCEGEFRAA